LKGKNRFFSVTERNKIILTKEVMKGVPFNG